MGFFLGWIVGLVTVVAFLWWLYGEIITGRLGREGPNLRDIAVATLRTWAEAVLSVVRR